MPEIWSIALTQSGLHACALNSAMNCRHYSASWRDQIEPVPVRTVLQETAKALCTLLKDAPAEEIPLALAISAPDKASAVLVDENHDPISGIYFDELLTPPRRDIPERYAQNPALASAWRNSILRRIRQTAPDFRLNQKIGLYSLGALIMQALTGKPVDPCIPLGVSSHFPEFPAEIREMMFSALGFDDVLCSRRAKSGFIAGKLVKNIHRRLLCPELDILSRLNAVPVYTMGDPDGARAYACASTPLCWSVSSSWDFKACWTAGCMALSAYQIQLNPSEESNPSSEMTADDWTLGFHAIKSLDAAPGPGKSLSTYGRTLSSAHSPIIAAAISSLIDPKSGRIPFQTLKNASTGSHGLHMIHDPSGWKIIGLQPAHGPAHLARALFEAQFYHLRKWQSELMPRGFGPIRLLLDKPWPEEAAQWAADILNRPVCFLQESPESLSAFGAALSLFRDICPKGLASPRLNAQIVDPSSRSAYYQIHYEVFLSLAEC